MPNLASASTIQRSINEKIVEMQSATVTGVKGAFLLAGVVVIAAVIAFGARYSLVAGGSDAAEGMVVWRLDHWTGKVSRCQSTPLLCQKVH
jgi:hypothetical protein